MDRLIFWLLKLFFTELLPAVWRGLVFLTKAARKQLGEASSPAGNRQNTSSNSEAQGLPAHVEAAKNALSQVAQLREHARGLKTKAQAVGGPLRVWDDILAEELRELEALAIAWQSTPAATQKLTAKLHLHTARRQALAFGYRFRTDPEQAEMMADAEAVAAAHLKPLVDFSAAQQLEFPRKRPVCFPAAGREAIWFGLFPAKYPVIFVPSDFNRELLRWPSIAHEVGHLVWRSVPELSEEVGDLITAPGTPATWDRAADIDTTQFFSVWQEEIFCDLLATLQLGPAAVRGMLHLFSPDDSSAFDRVRISLDETGQYLAKHPPPQLRVQLALAVLKDMGFNAQAKELDAHWLSVSGQPESYALPDPSGRYFGVSSETFDAPGRSLVRRLYAAELESLSGFRLSTIPGFAMSPGLWARVTEQAEALSSEQYTSPSRRSPEDARILIAAAIETRADSASDSARIATRVRRAIVGLDEPARAKPRTPVAETAPRDPSTELLEALILRDVLAPRTMLTRTRRGYGRL